MIVHGSFGVFNVPLIPVKILAEQPTTLLGLLLSSCGKTRLP